VNWLSESLSQKVKSPSVLLPCAVHARVRLLRKYYKIYLST